MAAADYTAEYTSAHADVLAAGTAVTFTRVGASTGVYDAATDTRLAGTERVTTHPAAAMRVRGNPQTYARLNLSTTDAPTLLIVPDTMGDLPAPGDTVVWASVPYTARDVDPIAPSGAALMARVVVSR